MLQRHLTWPPAVLPAQNTCDLAALLAARSCEACHGWPLSATLLGMWSVKMSLIPSSAPCHQVAVSGHQLSRSRQTDAAQTDLLRVPQMLYEKGLVEAEARIHVTGHSLGGALAILAAHDIAAQLRPASLQVCAPALHPAVCPAGPIR